MKADDEICQILGKALGYPWFKDDQKNFPGCTESDGVCVGEHVGATLAEEAAQMIARLRKERDNLRAALRINGLRAGHSHAEIDALLEKINEGEI